MIALVAGRMAALPATRFQTFDSLRAEIVGAQANGFFSLRMAGLVFWMSLMRLQNPVDLPTTPMLSPAGGALITELISLSLLHKAQKTNLNIKGAYWHIV